MSLLDKLTGRLNAPKLTRGRIVLALLLAVATDALQVTLPVPPVPEIIDVITMLVMVWLLGFHVLLLPTFVVEFIPVVGMLPTWTACVAAVIALRKREQRGDLPPANVHAPPPIAPPQQALPPISNPPPPPAHD